MENMMSETLSKANGAAKDFKHEVQSVEKQLEKMSHNVGKKIGKMSADIADSASEYVQTGREYVQENPIKGVAIAAAAGLVAGSLITLAMRRRH